MFWDPCFHVNVDELSNSFDLHTLEEEDFQSIKTWVSELKFTSLTGCGTESVRQIFNTKILIYKPKTNLDHELQDTN